MGRGGSEIDGRPLFFFSGVSCRAWLARSSLVYLPARRSSADAIVVSKRRGRAKKAKGRAGVGAGRGAKRCRWPDGIKKWEPTIDERRGKNARARPTCFQCRCRCSLRDALCVCVRGTIKRERESRGAGKSDAAAGARERWKKKDEEEQVPFLLSAGKINSRTSREGERVIKKTELLSLSDFNRSGQGTQPPPPPGLVPLASSAMEGTRDRRRDRGRFRGGGGGVGGAGGGRGFGGIGSGAARAGDHGGSSAAADFDFFAFDPHQRALLAALAAHRQLLPPSEADSREVRDMNSGYRSAVVAAVARSLEEGDDEEKRRGVIAAKGELNGLMRRYLEVRERVESERSERSKSFPGDVRERRRGHGNY